MHLILNFIIVNSLVVSWERFDLGFVIGCFDLQTLLLKASILECLNFIWNCDSHFCLNNDLILQDATFNKVLLLNAQRLAAIDIELSIYSPICAPVIDLIQICNQLHNAFQLVASIRDRQSKGP